MAHWIKSIITIGLAWLGLAGITDNIVEWQDWFEVGIMQHWRSVKTWIVAVLLDWMPFNVRLWMIDWLVIGSIHMRAAIVPQVSILQTKHIFPFESKWVILTHRIFWVVLNVVWLLLCWPLSLGMNIYNWMSEYSSENQKVYSIIRRAKGWDQSPYWRESIANAVARDATRRQIFLAISLFIPVLFVCSKILYEFG